LFNGTTRIVGAGSADANGQGYMNIILNQSFEPAPIRIDIDSFDPVTGAVSATVSMYSATYVLNNDDFYILLIEDDVDTTPATYDHTHVTRAMYSDTISLTGVGNTSMFNTTFTIDPSWDTTKLRAIAIVQEQDQQILQAASSDPQPDFKARAMVPFSRTAFGPSAMSFETEAFTVINVGLTETFTIDLIVDVAPPDWTVAFKDNGGATHTDPLAFGLAGDESTTFKAVINAVSPGYIRCHFEVTSPNLVRPLEIPFVYITDDVDSLIVDDDGGEGYEDYFTEALDTAGMSYGVWDRGASALTPDVADTFDVLIWNVGFAFPTLDADDRDFLTDHLDDGKALLVSGQDVGWELNYSNGSNYDPVWYQTYLHANWIRDDTNIMYLDGVPGDLITDGLTLHIEGGTGANNQEYPDEIAAADADATEILHYQGDGCGAVRSEDSMSGAKVVYLGFGFEAIDNAQDRHDLLAPALRWLRGVIFEDGFESGDTSAWSAASP
jgi:hypothetical protein